MKITPEDVEAVAALAVGSLDDVSYLLAESLIDWKRSRICESKMIAIRAIEKAMQ